VQCTSDSSTTHNVQLRSTLHLAVWAFLSWSKYTQAQPNSIVTGGWKTMEVVQLLWILPWTYCMTPSTSGNKAAVVHTDERGAKDMKKSMMREVPPHCVFPTECDSRGKWGWVSCAIMGQKIHVKLLGCGLVTLCCLNIPSRRTVQQQHVSVTSTGCKTPQTVPQLLVTRAISHGDHGDDGFEEFLHAFSLTAQIWMLSCYRRSQCTVILAAWFVGYLVP